MKDRQGGEYDTIREGDTHVERAHVGPCHHIHRGGTTRIHGHVGKQTVVIPVYVQTRLMPSNGSCQQTIGACRPTSSWHIHVNLHVRPMGVVHLVDDMVIVDLGLP